MGRVQAPSSHSNGLRLVGQGQVQVERGVCEWPDKTEFLCWHCAHSYTTPPVPRPIGYDQKLRRYTVRGCYCTWSCAAAACLNIRESGYLYNLHKEVCGNDNRIVPAPPKYLLRAFGGTMNIEDYRRVEEEYKVVPSRLITVEGLNVQSTTTTKAKPANGKMDFSTATAPNDNLKLRREKPLPSNRGQISMHTKVKR